MVGMPRTLEPRTQLARTILDSGKKMYEVAAEIGINPIRLSELCAGRRNPSPADDERLRRWLHKDPDGNHADLVPFKPTSFSAACKRLERQPLVLTVVVKHDQVAAWALDNVKEPLSMTVANSTSRLVIPVTVKSIETS